MSYDANIRTSNAVAQFFGAASRARARATAESDAELVQVTSEPSGVRIEVAPPPSGFGPWRQSTYREWAIARRDGLPAMQFEVTNDDQFESVYWTAPRVAR